jgi:hypothetical protein
LNELLLFGAPIIALSKLSSHLTYDDMISTKFQPKQQKKDIWTTKKVAFFFETFKDISNGVLVPTVFYLYKYFYI